MGEPNNFDPIDRKVSRVLSLYEDLDILRLGSELGENGLTREGLATRLGSLMTQGVVKQIINREGGMRWALNRREFDDNRTDLQAG